MPSSSPRASSPKSEPDGSPADELALGVDLGGTKVVSGLVDRQGTVVRTSGRVVHSNAGPSAVVAAVIRSAKAALELAPLPPRAIGVAVAGQIDPRTGTVIHAPNLGWRDLPLARRLEDELGIPVRVVNDARAATYAEWQFGAGAGVDDLFCLALGTGIGGSAVLGGRLIEGGSHAAGEVGHLTIVSGGRKCHCPNWGCLEAYVGGWAIGERAVEAIREARRDPDPLVERAGGIDRVTARVVFEAYRGNDPVARRVVRETERYLTDGVVGIVNAFNPTVLVVAGGLVAGLPELVPAIETTVRARCQPSAASARVVRARFTEEAPMIGAAALARAALGARPGPRRT